MRVRTNAVAKELLGGGLRVDPGVLTLRQTREDVEKGWQAMREILTQQGQIDLAEAVARFARRMPPPRTERERLARELKVTLPERSTRER